MADAKDVLTLDYADGNTPSPQPAAIKPYEPERQRDIVRMFVTLGLLASFLGLIFWACRESVTSAVVWTQTKDMMQIILPALSGLLGSVIGFYFGSGANLDRKP